MERSLLLFVLFTISINSVAQQDTITFNNDNILVGEIKEMQQGVLKIETDYSDSDFLIEWIKIKTIKTETNFLINLSDGRRFNGRLASDSIGNTTLFTFYHDTFTVRPEQIVFLESVDKGFWSQVYASIDFGWDITKANNLRQASMRSNIGYLAERWSTNAYYNAINSNQKNVEKVSRDDAGIDFKYFFERRWFSVISTTFLSNTEQKLNLRTNGKLGLGAYLVQTNAVYWNISGGASFNIERYQTSSDNRNSWEGYFATELKMFDTGDISLTSKIGLYPSITESGRWRSDFNFDVKYDLPKDFYVKLGITYNYDNQPVQDASSSDYVFATGFGWEL